MGFIDYSGNIYETMQKIADDFKALAEFGEVTAAEGEHAFKHETENIYVRIYEYFQEDSNDEYIFGYAFDFSSDWDSVAKIGIGNLKRMEIPYYNYDGEDHSDSYDSAAEREPYMSKVHSIKYWLDKYGIIAVTHNPYTSPDEATAVTFGIEFIPVSNREFDDGLNSLYAWRILSDALDNTYLETTTSIRGLLTSHETNQIFESPKAAYKSAGNNKIYFEFPYYFNDFDLGTKLIPSARTKRWFPVNKSDAGLVSNDVISWLDPETATIRKFIICECSTGENSTASYYAIPYDNAFQYTV